RWVFLSTSMRSSMPGTPGSHTAPRSRRGPRSGTWEESYGPRAGFASVASATGAPSSTCSDVVPDGADGADGSGDSVGSDDLERRNRPTEELLHLPGPRPGLLAGRSPRAASTLARAATVVVRRSLC